MARRIPENRFDELVCGAVQVFIERGYRLTQMSDIAEAIGVAKGTLYGYVESKDTLFLLCIARADQPGLIALPEGLPLKAPIPGAIGSIVKAQLAEAVAWPSLAAALDEPRAPDLRAELTQVIGDFFDLMESNRHGIKLLDRCMDHPELGQLWQTAGREQPRLAFARYLDSRISAGQIRELADVRLATRLVVETCATWAVHIYWDRAPDVFDHEKARENVIDFLVCGLIA